MSLPSMLPSLRGIVINPVWFNVDSPCDDEADVAGLEQEHQSWVWISEAIKYNVNVNRNYFFYSWTQSLSLT